MHNNERLENLVFHGKNRFEALETGNGNTTLRTTLIRYIQAVNP